MRSILLCPLLALVACSGSGGSVGGDPGRDGGPTASPPSNDAGADGATPPVDAGRDGATPDTRIDPIVVGHTWTYDVTILGTYPLCRAGSNVGQVLGEKQVSGKNALQVQSFCPGAGTSSYAVDGDRVEILYGGTWILALDAPVAEGHTWSNGAATFTWEKKGEVTVKAGTFDDCWTARQNNSQSYTVFCRGVGPVQWHYVEGINGYDAVLTAKNF